MKIARSREHREPGGGTAVREARKRCTAFAKAREVRMALRSYSGRMPTAPSLPRLSAAVRSIAQVPNIKPAPRNSNDGACRYSCPRRSRLTVIVSITVSLVIHVGVLFGLSGRRKVDRVFEKPVIALTFAIPHLHDLEEPEPAPSEDVAPKTDLGSPTPMLADLPQVPQPNDFVQQMDFSTLVDRPDLSLGKLWTVPENIRRGGKGGEGLGNVFNLSDLDRVPRPVMQPAPLYPASMKREGITATVVVDFIVDAQGRVVNPSVFDSTHHDFELPAMVGVQKWRFSPGVRAGQKVNTRMRVPIVFTIADAID